MIIDYNDIDQRQFKRVMKRSGLVEDIATFSYADEALEHIKNNPDLTADVIFLDVNMPRMNGFEFLDAANAGPEKMLCKSVVVMLTTSLNPCDRERAEAYEVVKAFINKPLTPENFSHVVEIVQRQEQVPSLC